MVLRLLYNEINPKRILKKIKKNQCKRSKCICIKSRVTYSNEFRGERDRVQDKAMVPKLRNFFKSKYQFFFKMGQYVSNGPKIITAYVEK